MSFTQADIHCKRSPAGARSGERFCSKLVLNRSVLSAESRVGVVSSDLDRLARLAEPSGGWSYRPGQTPHIEPTCLALLALSREAGRFADAIAAGWAALERSAGDDGLYRVPGAREQAVWPTALVLFTQAALGRPADEVSRTAAALLAVRGRVPDDPRAAEQHDIDHRIVGWPWAEGTFSWTEPTAWACLALRRAGYGDHERVRDGLRLLLDRASDDGGINYGNRRIFGRTTEPQTEPTALMVLALQGGPSHPRISAAVQYLLRQALAGDELEQLSWARLALGLYREEPGVADALPQIDERIRQADKLRSETTWLAPSPARVALAALALASNSANAFRLPDGIAAAPPRPAPTLRTRERPGLGERFRGVLRGWALRGAGRLRPLPESSVVHIACAPSYDIDLIAILRQQFETFRNQVPLAGKRVVLKPNIVEYHRDKVINTDPRVIAAAIELCRSEGAAEVLVAEGPGHCRNVEFLVRASGLGEVLERYGVPFVDINHDEPVRMLNLGRLTGQEYLYLSRTVATAEVLISLPKLKTHHWAGATLSLKNLFGILPGTCYGWPKNELHWRGIDNSIVDIALTRTPDLAIVDAIVGMEGDGPLNGTPKPLGGLVMGTDLLAVDGTCCRLMQLDPSKIGYLVLGERNRLGHLNEARIRQAGQPISALAKPFETLPHLRALCIGRPA